MNKDCSIVQDLLPLYAEDMLREGTKEYVDGHLAQCEACRTELTALKTEDVTPASVSAAARLKAAIAAQKAHCRAAGRRARADTGDGRLCLSHRAAVPAV